nr:putative Gag-polypeptide of LTR copia-type [Tanacetum cinerariifolium]
MPGDDDTPPPGAGGDGSNSSEANYYHTLNGLWRQFDFMAKLPACSCDALKALKTHSDLIKLMQFLMGLDDVYQPIRNSLLSGDPIPDLKTAFSVISREESHRGSSSSSSRNKPQVSVFPARGPNNNNYNKKNQPNKNSNVVCTNPDHIKKNRQTIITRET